VAEEAAAAAEAEAEVEELGFSPERKRPSSNLEISSEISSSAIGALALATAP
jgi:hypothetical protein